MEYSELTIESRPITESFLFGLGCCAFTAAVSFGAGVMTAMYNSPSIDRARVFRYETNRPSILAISDSDHKETTLYENPNEKDLYDIKKVDHLKDFSAESTRDSEGRYLEKKVKGEF